MLKQEAGKMLADQIIPFWKNLRDDVYGGYYGYVGYDLAIDPKAEKGCILNSRILWFFSRCAKDLNRADCLEYAEHAYKFLQTHCIDKEHGGVYWSVDYKGEPLDDSKHTYAQAFAVYALAAYYEASGERTALDTACELFRLIEERCKDENGYLEAFDRQFRPASNEKLSENGVMAYRTMNTLLHVFEGCSELYRVSHLDEVGNAMREILDIYRYKVYDPKLHRQEVFFDADYNSLIDLHSYGHDIESSWLIDWGCGLLGDRELSESISEINSQLAQNIFETAYQDHSLVNECEKGKVDTTRIWWVQAEAVLGFVNQWQKHPDEIKYLKAAQDIFQFIQNVMTDKRSGSEWYWGVDANGRPDPNRPFVDPWKCPYHNGRMCLELIKRDPDASRV